MTIPPITSATSSNTPPNTEISAAASTTISKTAQAFENTYGTPSQLTEFDLPHTPRSPSPTLPEIFFNPQHPCSIQ